MGKNSLKWDRLVSCGTEQSHVGQTGLKWDRSVFCGTEDSYKEESGLVWEMAVCTEKQSHMGQTSLKFDIRSKIPLLKMDKSRNVLKASKYFSMIFKSLLDCQKVQNNFSEV